MLRVRRIILLLALGSALLALCGAAPRGLAVTYEVRGYGASNVILVLSGTGLQGLSVTPSSDGMSVRVSGVGVVFSRKGDDKSLPLISSVRQVKRGTFTDLIFNLTAASQVNATPSSSSLQVTVARLSAEATPSPAPTATPPALSPQAMIAALEESLSKLKGENALLKAELQKKDTLIRKLQQE